MRTLLVCAVLVLGACKGEATVTKFCLSEEGNSQDCGIACKVTKDKRACDKWADLTHKICGKISKAECQEICEKDENPTACELAAQMK